MRIACLQFAPQVGDVNNNLHRADAILAKAKPDDLVDLDLIVLPELAFTGYNFKSLANISPFLEPQGSGISALWARTTALKYDTNVIVGYPERVDVSVKWPTGPEYYNSAIVVNGDGETIANYRKSFLYATDETWALEGDQGFFAGDIPGLGSTAMGICMDLNPYRFEAPWDAFEFAYHIQAIEANLVIVTMAWLTLEDSRQFTRMPEEPDIETLTYWVQRLEPLIRNEDQDEVIVVFCNRTGIEGELVYAGTSSVVGIKDGEVRVYGILGRGVKDLLVVDTENGPFAKLVQRPEGEDQMASQVSAMSGRPRGSAGSPHSISTHSSEPASTASMHSSQRGLGLTPEDSWELCKARPKSPRIQIPQNYFKSRSVSCGTPIEESPGITTPTCPSPTPLSHRPQVDSPKTDSATGYSSLRRQDSTPLENASHSDRECVSCTAVDTSTVSPGLDQIHEKYFRSDTQRPLKSPMAFRFPEIYKGDTSKAETPVPSSLVKIDYGKHHTTKNLFNSSMPYSPDSQEFHRIVRSEHATDNREYTSVIESKDTQRRDSTPHYPSSLKSRNASRTGRSLSHHRSEVEQRGMSRSIDRLKSMNSRPGSAANSIHFDTEEPRQGRVRARKSSITAMDRLLGQSFDRGLENVSPKADTMFASPGGHLESSAQPRSRGNRDSGRTNSRHTTLNEAMRPCSRAGARSRNTSVTEHSDSLLESRSGSTSNSRIRGVSEPQIEPDETRTRVWCELTKMVGEVLDTPQNRDVSRGRHRLSRDKPLGDALLGQRETHSETRGGRRIVPRSGQRFASQNRIGSAIHAPMRTIPAPVSMNGQYSPHDPDDEIVAEIIFHTKGRTAHSQVNSPQGNAIMSGSSQVSPTALAPLDQKTAACQNQSHTYRSSSEHSLLRQHRRAASHTESVDARRASFKERPGDIVTHKAHVLSTSTAQRDSSDSCATTDGASILTSTSRKSPRATPPSRVFEPTTPKAMKFDPEPVAICRNVPGPVSGAGPPYLDSLQQELLKIGILAPEHVA